MPTGKKNVTNIELTEKIKQILIKKAEGYDYSEETYEYQKMPASDKQLSFDDIFDIENESQLKTKNKRQSKKNNTTQNEKELTLIKKKVTTHHIPPDMLAIKILLENFGKNENSEELNLEKLSDEELIALKDNILESLKNIEKEDDNEG